MVWADVNAESERMAPKTRGAPEMGRMVGVKLDIQVGEVLSFAVDVVGQNGRWPAKERTDHIGVGGRVVQRGIDAGGCLDGGRKGTRGSER
jgi:hypothetical protein